eukprot:TRINITY_DN85282_c0_g1_i1.p1 TRINITY_DN85282_c0_g1~~TRINITY_DN85282_c0_g1_i1.p1  ORF type:complete len:331 (-),score=40.15 TRINITY_DN85282_c0_g1_i1:112-1104(-)
MSTVEFVAGSTDGHADGGPTQAKFNKPHGLACDGEGCTYVADHENHCIRKVDAAGNVTTIAGQPGKAGFKDGAGPEAQFNWPCNVIFCGEYLIIADTHNNRIRKFSLATNQVDTLCGNGNAGFKDGPAGEAEFNYPQGLCVSVTGETVLYVADTFNCRIRQVDVNSGAVSNFAGTGEAGYSDDTAATSLFENPQDVACDSEGNIFVADTDNNRIRMVSTDGTVTTYAGEGGCGSGDGDAAEATFAGPTALCCDATGFLYIADADNNMVRVISPTGEVSTLAGDLEEGYQDGSVETAKFSYPRGIDYDGKNRALMVADACNAKIRRIRIAA